ncbi:MAG TPA: hypothetical protein VGK67_13720 [Myxococcales bacterium]|jgi:hypothetical protein
MKTYLPRALALLALVSLAACIQRPESPREQRENIDRAGLGTLGIILKAVPDGAGRNLRARFGDAVELVAVDHQPRSPKPGDTVNVAFYYRVVDETDDDWKIFVHVDNRGGAVDRINGDHWPAKDKYRTSSWKKGEIVRDDWSFKVPGSYQGDGLDVWTGFYMPGKDDRWPLTNKSEVQNDGQNRVLATTVVVAK